MNQPQPHRHIVKSYDDDIGNLDALIEQMGEAVLAQLADSMEALLREDEALALQVIRKDNEIDAMEDEIFQQTTRIIALRQPMADDLRRVISALRVGNDIERIGDHAENTAKRLLQLKNLSIGMHAQRIKFLAQLTEENLSEALRAYMERDAALAVTVCTRDDRIDEAYNSLFRELLTYMVENPSHITLCSHLLLVAKNLERIGDHATNIAETAYFVRLGRRMEKNRSE